MSAEMSAIGSRLSDLTYRFTPLSGPLESQAFSMRNDLKGASAATLSKYLLLKGGAFVLNIPEGIVEDFVVRPLQVAKFYQNKAKFSK